MLLGREAEQRVLDDLLRRTRAGHSAVLVLRGEPGIGKTALLRYAEAGAEGMTVLRCAGIEAEHEFPFAGPHQLLRPCLGLLDRLPTPQAAALRGAFGLAFDPVHSRFFVSLGLLSLLAESSEQAPLLLAAAEESGDPHTLEPALKRCSLSVSDFAAAEEAGLVQVDGAVVFRHPLVRSAVYRSAPVAWQVA